jgi:hypothetical protein
MRSRMMKSSIKGDWGRRPQQAKGKVGTTLPCLQICKFVEVTNILVT